MGDMADQYDYMLWDDDFDDDQPHIVKCYRCNKRIELLSNGVRWRPYEIGGDKLHQCNPPIDPNEFEAIAD